MATEVYEWVLSGTLAGQFVQTVQHVKVNRTVSTTQWECANRINNEFKTAGNVFPLLLDCLPEDYSVTSVRTRCVNPTGGPTAVALKTSFIDTDGQRSGEISSSQVNPLIIWVPTTTPAKTGRLFLPGVSEDDIDEMAIVSALAIAIDAFILYYSSGGTIDGTGDTWVGCVARRAPTSPYNVTSGDVISVGYTSPLIGTQRRRLHPV